MSAMRGSTPLSSRTLKPPSHAGGFFFSGARKMTPKALAAELRSILGRLEAVIGEIDGGSAFPAWMTDNLEPDGAWRPAWLVSLNDEARKFRPDGYVNAAGNFEWTPVNLIHSVLWWPILKREDLTQGQREEYDRVQVDAFGVWMQAAASRWPIIAWPRGSEDRTKPGGELRHAVLAPTPGASGALPTENELRACIESHYRASGYLPAE